MESGLVSDSLKKSGCYTYVLDNNDASPGWSKLSTRLVEWNVIENVFGRDGIALSQIVEEWWICNRVDHEKTAVIDNVSDLRELYRRQRRMG